MRSPNLDLGFVVTLDDLGKKNVIASWRLRDPRRANT
jgi:hypothetical protein